MLDLKQKKALITGAGSGIGKAIALSLAKKGVSVFLVGRNLEKLKKTVAEITAQGGTATCASCDLTQEEQILSMLSQVKETLGSVDFVINNAGLAQNMPFQEIPTLLWDQIMATNVRAPFLICKNLLPELKASSFGTIINICSVVAHKGYPDQGAYAASKHALYGLSKVMANELYQENVRVHCICPGGVYTDMVKETRPDLDASGLMVSEDIAAIALFFLEHRDSNGVIDEINVHRPGKAPFA